MKDQTPTALITGASEGLGYALAKALVQRGWQLIINARNARNLRAAQLRLQEFGEVIAVSGDVRDEIHLMQFAEILEREGRRLDLVVNNASTLGASPQPPLLEYQVDDLHRIYHTNVIAPLSLLQKLRPFLSTTPIIINISSDAGAEPYEGWGGYGASKAALDHWTAILAREQPDWHVYAFDPGDMRTRMHQEAYPNEDLGHLPLPQTKAVPALLNLLDRLPKSGRHTVNQWAPEAATGSVGQSAEYLAMLK